MKTSADLVKVEYSDVNVPLIFRKMDKKADIFSRDGLDLPAQTFEYSSHLVGQILPEEIPNEERLKLIEAKEAFNTALDTFISVSQHVDQKTHDYDILGKGKRVPEQLRQRYTKMGDNRILSFKKTIETHGNSDDSISVFMEAFTKDEKEYAVGPAIRLFDAGVSVWKYFGGERYGCGRTAEILPECERNLHRLLSSFGNLKTISEEVGIDKKTLEKIEKGEIKVGYRDAKALQKYFSKQVGSIPDMNSQLQLVKEEPYIFMIEREFFPGTTIESTEPQQHSTWYAKIIPGWEKGCNAIETEASLTKSENIRVKKENLDAFRLAYA